MGEPDLSMWWTYKTVKKQKVGTQKVGTGTFFNFEGHSVGLLATQFQIYFELPSFVLPFIYKDGLGGGGNYLMYEFIRLIWIPSFTQPPNCIQQTTHRQRSTNDCFIKKLCVTRAVFWKWKLAVMCVLSLT